MIRLELAGHHTRQTSTLCASCPDGRAGCCAAPPAVAFADLGRIAHLGGGSWILGEIEAGRLFPVARGLAIRRVEPGRDEGGAWPARCVYLGPAGCVIPAERRSATCNYYLCERAFVDSRAEHEIVKMAREAQETLTELYGRWDIELAELVAERYPEGPAWDVDFLEWLGREHERLVKKQRRALRRLSGSSTVTR